MLLAHPAVRGSCTVGVPNDDWGEEVRGVVALRTGFVASSELEAELRAFVRSRVAAFKVPRRIDVVDDIPHSVAGKILRAQVRAGYWAGHARSI